MNSNLLKQNQTRFKELNITKWQDNGITGKGIKVGIIGFSPNSHHNGSDLIHQVAPGCEIIEYNVMDNDTHRYTWEEAFTQMIKDQVQVVCSSLEKRYWNDNLVNLSKRMYEQNMIMVTSSGNDGERIKKYPSSQEEWISIGAYDERKKDRAGYSNYGQELFGLGYTNYVCKNNKGDYVPISHTSGTTQVIAGMAALLKETSNVTPSQFKKVMTANAIKLVDKEYDLKTGYGLLRLPEDVPSNLKIDPKEGDKMFKDVKPTDWFYKAVTWAKEKGILKGYGDNTFRPNEPLTRAEYAQAEYNKYFNK